MAYPELGVTGCIPVTDIVLRVETPCVPAMRTKPHIPGRTNMHLWPHRGCPYNVEDTQNIE